MYLRMYSSIIIIICNETNDALNFQLYHKVRLTRL